MQFLLPKTIFPLLIIFIVTIFLSACGEEAKKPPAPPLKKAPEVAKYDEEPTITLFRKATGEKQELKLEEYLKGVVAAEIGPQFPMEALKAQAIIARTMTLALIEYENGTQSKYGTDASDDHTEFQAYDETAINAKIAKAVEDTRGEVISYDGKFIYAMYHSLSADKTASVEEGFPALEKRAQAYLKPVATNGQANAPDKYIDWTIKVPIWQLRNIMGAEAGDLSDIDIGERGPSGRALSVTAGDVSIPAIELRQQVGFDTLFSTIFTDISVEGNFVVFQGTGWGHGVGMEQWGAYTMAAEGKSAKEIVEHYYTGTRWLDLWD